MKVLETKEHRPGVKILLMLGEARELDEPPKFVRRNVFAFQVREEDVLLAAK